MVEGTDIPHRLEPSTPVLLAWATTSRRGDWRSSDEAAALMGQVARQALERAGLPGGAVDWIGVPDGMTTYRDPGRLVAQALGAPGAHTVLAEVGVQQNTLIARAIRGVQSGRFRVAVVCGGEARRRSVKAGADGMFAPVTAQDPLLRPDETMRSPLPWQLAEETATGLLAPGFYALMESALRAERQESPAENRERIARQYAEMSRATTRNPLAVTGPLGADAIAADTVDNPMIAFPYSKHVVSRWTVDQAAALVVTTVAVARELHADLSSGIFPVVSSEANHLVPMTARSRLTQPAAMPAVSDVAAAVSGMEPRDADLVDLYSCFPFAVEMAAQGIGLGPDRERSVGGGMAFAGGPLNSAVLHATALAAERMDAGAGATALITCVSGDWTKQGLTLWSTQPPLRPFAAVDVTSVVAAREPALRVLPRASGRGTIVGCTVLHDGGVPVRAVAVVDAGAGRTMVTSEDPSVMAALVELEGVGRPVALTDGTFELSRSEEH